MPVLSFKVTPEQAREVRRSAKLQRMTVSDYLRRATFPPSAKKRLPKDDIRPGRVVIATPPLTKEIIDSALYD
ncbi:hypothetical protein Ga0100231_011330 [Opitutaceae bacterium TAV4]|uniref:plasmid mobilization protein n=1 Tax=Geminisphaera colitermitum TaxID=1148786 RepID=UPI0001964ECE|nr:hypothetical protein [Geminisphaera colitermitum]RRJ94835.1 hypothetical protein Ga0100231_011330 [Opitutaceae bacterium TAV4]RRJ99067.1 hypothetical protein Ga0100230_012490 [Opitutaceae bacterium TAV3]